MIVLNKNKHNKGKILKVVSKIRNFTVKVVSKIRKNIENVYLMWYYCFEVKAMKRKFTTKLMNWQEKNIDKPLIIQFTNGSSVETIKGGLSIYTKHKVVKLLSEEEVKNIIEKN